MFSATLSKSGLGLFALLAFGGIENLPVLVGSGQGAQNSIMMTSVQPAGRAPTDPGFGSDQGREGGPTNASLRGLVHFGGLPSGCGDGADASDQVVPGDQIGLRVFENALNGADRFERRDLSGVFTVDSRGDIAVPGIGRVTVSDQPLACLEAPVAALYDAEMSIPAAVTASFVQRPPVLIKGAVIAPGSYDFSPGLTVDALVAKAGAGGGTADLALRRTLAARRDELHALRAELVVRHARMSAQRARVERLVLPAGLGSDLVQLLGIDRIEGEEAVLNAALAAMDKRAARDAGTREDLESSLALAVSRRELVRARYDSLIARRDALERVVASECIGRCGPARKQEEVRLEDLNDRVADMELTLQAAETQVVTARQAVDRHERDVALEAAEADNALAHQIAQTLTERNELEAQIVSIEAQLSDLRGATQQAITVERLSRDGNVSTIAGSGTMRLLPGDIVTLGDLDAPTFTLADGSNK